MAESSSSGAEEKDLEKLMSELGLAEEDLDDVVVEQEDPLPKEATRWVAIGRVHTPKTINQFVFFKTMRSTWDLAQPVKIRPLENNLYTFQFACLGDWEGVMQEGPWNFKGKAVILAEYDGFTKPSLIKLDTLEIWMQIHDLPNGFYPLIDSLTRKVGEFVYSETQKQ